MTKKNYVKEELEGMTCKQLLVIAKELQVVGRHDMRKAVLIEAIISLNVLAVETKDNEVESESNSSLKSETETKSDSSNNSRKLTFEEAIELEKTKRKYGINNPNSKKRYEKNAEVGMLVAFHVAGPESDMYSGMITEIHADKFRIETKRGIKYLVDKSAVAWYKTGKRWPRGVYEELTRDKRRGFGVKNQLC